MTLNVSVIGTSYLGATHAAGMAEFGHQVVGLDIDEDKVKILNAGQSHIFEVGLEPLLEKHTATGRLRFTTDMAEVAGAQVHFVCVGTPQRKGEYAADLRFVDAAVEALAPHLEGTDEEPALVVGKSTVPVGTAARLAGLPHAHRHRRRRRECLRHLVPLRRGRRLAVVPARPVPHPARARRRGSGPGAHLLTVQRSRRRLPDQREA